MREEIVKREDWCYGKEKLGQIPQIVIKKHTVCCCSPLATHKREKNTIFDHFKGQKNPLGEILPHTVSELAGIFR